MLETFITTFISALLVWEVLLLAPMVPGKLIDTRDFSALPRWQFNGFNFFLTSLSLISLIVAGFAIAGNTWVFWPSLVLSLLFILVFAFDLLGIFPVVEDKLPVQLLILESISLSSAGVLFILSVAGLRM
ncbi:MAG: hypothetical protein PHG27_05695 [Massilibacteroides sp.]|nr:hypothetical protein [Massilibacteroides sp.]MDD4115079.1 hypothetical protein [Massilibacteroides sp.]